MVLRPLLDALLAGSGLPGASLAGWLITRRDAREISASGDTLLAPSRQLGRRLLRTIMKC
jgi:hypothetical protein